MHSTAHLIKGLTQTRGGNVKYFSLLKVFYMQICLATLNVCLLDFLEVTFKSSTGQSSPL